MTVTDYRHGLVFRGVFRLWDWIQQHCVCRWCHARLDLRPYADPITGRLDFERYVCSGPDEHPIEEEGDLELRGQVEWEQTYRALLGQEVAQAYVVRRSWPGARELLYGDSDGLD